MVEDALQCGQISVDGSSCDFAFAILTLLARSPNLEFLNALAVYFGDEFSAEELFEPVYVDPCSLTVAFERFGLAQFRNWSANSAKVGTAVGCGMS